MNSFSLLWLACSSHVMRICRFAESEFNLKRPKDRAHSSSVATEFKLIRATRCLTNRIGPMLKISTAATTKFIKFTVTSKIAYTFDLNGRRLLNIVCRTSFAGHRLRIAKQCIFQQQKKRLLIEESSNCPNDFSLWKVLWYAKHTHRPNNSKAKLRQSYIISWLCLQVFKKKKKKIRKRCQIEYRPVGWSMQWINLIWWSLFFVFFSLNIEL